MFYHYNMCGSHDSYNIHSYLLGSATVSVCGYMLVFQNSVPVHSGLHFQSSSFPIFIKFFPLMAYCFTLKIGAASSS